MRNLSERLLGKTYLSPLMRAIWAPAAVLLALAVLVPAASAKTVILHYFSKETSNTILTPQGQPLAPNAQPSHGDISDETGVDYVGNHKYHAKRATASDHLRCTITSFASGGGAAMCDGQIAIGGSMLLANAVPLTFSATNAPTVVSINGGTGVYRHAHGRIVVTSVGNNTDFVIRVNIDRSRRVKCDTSGGQHGRSTRGSRSTRRGRLGTPVTAFPPRVPRYQGGADWSASHRTTEADVRFHSSLGGARRGDRDRGMRCNQDDDGYNSDNSGGHKPIFVAGLGVWNPSTKGHSRPDQSSRIRADHHNQPRHHARDTRAAVKASRGPRGTAHLRFASRGCGRRVGSADAGRPGCSAAIASAGARRWRRLWVMAVRGRC